MKTSIKYVLWFALSFMGLITLNILLISLFSQSASYGIEQIVKLKFYVLPLALSFSTQVVLFLRVREVMRNMALVVSGAGVISTGTMIACCAHHVVEAFPFLALSGLGVFFAGYQKELLVISTVINWLSVLYMFKKLRRLDGKQN